MFADHYEEGDVVVIQADREKLFGTMRVRGKPVFSAVKDKKWLKRPLRVGVAMRGQGDIVKFVPLMPGDIVESLDEVPGAAFNLKRDEGLLKST